MEFDFAIIGGGSAGYAAARTAVDQGLKVVVIEGGEEIGGLCILHGCMPSKALIESANRMITLRRAKEFGLRAENLAVHAEEIIARKRKFIGEFADYRREQLESGKFEFIRGFARFIDAHTIEIEWAGQPTRTLQARSFLIATGSKIQSPHIPGLTECDALTSDDALDLESLPPSLVVLGAGSIGLELTHYFSALGVEVTILQRGPQVLSGTDPDLAIVVEKALRARGVNIFTGTKIHSIESTATGKRVHFEHNGETRTVECAEILNALGRKPNIDGLGLDVVSVAHPHGHVNAAHSQQTSQPHIFAAGDCCGPHAIVHLAVMQGEIAARNAARLLAGKPEADFEKIDYRLKLFVVFTDPEVATVGMCESEAKESGVPYRVATYPFNDHGKSLVMDETEGFVKLITSAETGEILGAGVVGPHADDLIHEIVVAMHFHATAAQLAAIPHYHPTLSEIWTYPAEELAG